LFSENLVDRAFITAHSTGFDQLEKYVLGLQGDEAHSPHWAASICGVGEEEITRFARAYAAAKPAMLFPGYSIQRVFAGEETYRLTVALQVATANFGRCGGSTGALNNALPAPRVGILDVPQVNNPHLPLVRWPDAVLGGKNAGFPSDIHAIYNLGSNFLNQGADIHKNIAAFEKVDFAVTHELFMTPTARYCDVIFPAASPLEKEDIGIPWLGNYLLYKPQVVPPRGQARSDYDILCDLAERLGFLDVFSAGRSASAWVAHFIENSEITDVDEFRRCGIYLAPDQERVGLADFGADPDKFPLSTPSGKVEIASQRYHFDTGFPAIPTWQPAPTDIRFPLRLISPKSSHFIHSQGGNIPEVRAREAPALAMNLEDGAVRGITDGDTVILENSRGTVHIPVRLTGDLIPGVVCLPEGIWVELNPEGIDTAGSANMITDTVGTDPTRAPIMHGVEVEVRRLQPLFPL
jgi:anaerobic dimethyl sulfoxide reductase subunit A